MKRQSHLLLATHSFSPCKLQVQKEYDIRVQKIMLLKQDIFHAGHLLALENHVAYFFPSL